MKKIINKISDWIFKHYVGFYSVIGALIVIVGFFTLGFIIRKICVDESRKEYNNNICTECNTINAYEYHEAVGHRYGSTYIYKCKECGHTIEVIMIME